MWKLHNLTDTNNELVGFQLSQEKEQQIFAKEKEIKFDSLDTNSNIHFFFQFKKIKQTRSKKVDHV